MSTANEILENTRFVMIEWRNEALLKAPPVTIEILSQAKTDWIVSLTEELVNEYTLITDNEISDGKLIILNTVLGSLVESWLKFFYTVYHEDYQSEDTGITRRVINHDSGETKLIDPNDLKLEQLKQFSAKIWEGSEFYTFIENVQHKRNIIHSFNTPKFELGEKSDFHEAIKTFSILIKDIKNRLPDIDY